MAGLGWAGFWTGQVSWDLLGVSKQAEWPKSPRIVTKTWQSVLLSLRFSCRIKLLLNHVGSFSCPQVKATPITSYLSPAMWILPGKPHQKTCILPPGTRFLMRYPPQNTIGLVLSSNWAGLLWKPGNPAHNLRLAYQNACLLIILAKWTLSLKV